MSLIKKVPVTIQDEDAEVKKVFDDLCWTPGRIDKESILKQSKENLLFQESLHFLLNPYIVTGLSDKKISKKVDGKRTRTFEDITEVIWYLRDHNTGTDEDIANVQGYINDRDPKMYEFYKALFTKSIRPGIGATTVNKVYGKGFIPEFEVMLAEKYFENTAFVEGKEFTVTLKLDGIRCVAIKDSGKVRFFSRQGQEIFGLVEIQEELENLQINDFILDGELIADVIGTSAEQYKETTKIVRTDGEKRGVIFYAFDTLPLENFISKSSTASYRARREVLNRFFNDLCWVKVLPALYTGTDTAEILELLTWARKHNHEGVMVNINNAPYEFKRTKNLLKVKAMQDVDLEIIGYEEGSGRLSGTLGRLNVDYKGNTLGVGGGFSDEQRAWIWAHRDNLIGRVITVQYFEETQNADGKKSLRFPVFKELREEGKEVSYS